jgi:hypothetical protein
MIEIVNNFLQSVRREQLSAEGSQFLDAHDIATHIGRSS